MPPWPPGAESPAYVGQEQRTLTRRRARHDPRAGRTAGGRGRRPGARQATAPKPTQPRAGETLLRLAHAGRRTGRAHEGRRPTTTAASSSTRSWPETRSSPRPGSSPARPTVVHHVILFRVGPAQVGEAKRLDAADAGPGLDLLRRHRALRRRPARGIADSLNNANWIAGWAPGWGGSRLPDGTGVPLPAESQVVMQVHYNLLNGAAPTARSAVLTVAPASAGLDPVADDAPARPGRARRARRGDGRAVRPDEALFELSRKYGSDAAFVPAGLLSSAAERGEPGRERRLDLRPAHHDADDDPRRRRAHAPAGRVDHGSSSTRGRRARRCCSTSRAGTSTGRTPTCCERP